MTIPARQPQGIPTGGQFAPVAHGEASVSLDAPARKNQEWHDLSAELTADGRSLGEAKSDLAAVLALQATKTLFSSAQQHLRSGHETSAAMLTIAASSLRGLPSAIEASAGDTAKAKESVAAARLRLKSSGQLLDMVHPSGRQPVFRGTDEVLADLEDFLSPS
jgi:hypothetical protein